MGVSAWAVPTTAPTCPPRGCPSRAARSWVLLPNPPRAVRDVRGRGAQFLHCRASVFKRVFALASASSRHRRAHLCRLLAVALLSFDLGFFHCFFFFFYNRKKILQKRHICVGDSAQTQTTTAERGRECEVAMEPDYTGTPVGSWCGAAGAMGMCQGEDSVPGRKICPAGRRCGAQHPSQQGQSCWLERVARSRGLFLNQHTGFALI